MLFLLIPSRVGCFAGVGLSAAWLGSSLVGRKEEEMPTANAAVERRFHTVQVRYRAVLDVVGVCMSIRVRGVNLHKEGAMVMAARPLKVDSIVFFHDQTHRAMGFARVRHCTPKSPTEYRIGLEFENKLMKAEPGTWHIQRIAQD
jgi:hypothetical protein